MNVPLIDMYICEQREGYYNGLMDLIVLLEDAAVAEEAHDGGPADTAVPDEMP